RTGSVVAGSQVLNVLQKGTGAPQFFGDVTPSHPFYDYITLLKENGVTAGCGATTFCPDGNVTRGEMSALVIRSIVGENFTFSSTPSFTDVPATHALFKYIQKMKELGITTGCTTTNFCPDSPVTRGQMAVFLVRAALGISSSQNVPSTMVTSFSDVQSTNIFFSYIQKVKAMGISAGCAINKYCPDDLTTRGQMAVFLIRSFFTP